MLCAMWCHCNFSSSKMTPTNWCNKICCRFHFTSFQVRKSIALGEYVAFLQYMPVVEKLLTFLKKGLLMLSGRMFFVNEKTFFSSTSSSKLYCLGEKYAAYVNFFKFEDGYLGHLFHLIWRHSAVVGT